MFNVTVAEFVTDVTAVSSSVVDTMTSVLSLFCQPPLVLFTGLCLAGAAFAIVRRVFAVRKR